MGYNFSWRNFCGVERNTCYILNGEYYKIAFPFSQKIKNTLVALPREFMLPVLFEKLPYPYVLHFDEFELMDAFEKLTVNGELVHIEVWPGVTRESTRVRAYNDKGSIALAKTIIANK